MATRSVRHAAAVAVALLIVHGVAAARGVTPLACYDKATRLRSTCSDQELMVHTRNYAVAQPYRQEQFAMLDASFARWRGGGQQFGDGSWELALFLPGLMESLTSLNADTIKLATWKRQQPDSQAAQFGEAAMWYGHAVLVKGRDPHHQPSREANAIAAVRLAKAAMLLAALKTRMHDSPAWAELQLAILLEQGAGAAARKVFDDAVQRFPHYHPLYLRLGRAYGETALDLFAAQAVELTRQFEGRGMRARLYREAGATPPQWQTLRDSYEDLMQRFPASVALATSYASALCQTDDSVRYRQMRSLADAYLDPAYFSPVPVAACDQRHGWKAAPRPMVVVPPPVAEHYS